jgi:3-oxoacyl-[acyl-carrier protein] reductase
MIDPGLRERTVLVTGGNNPHGIGAATAKAFAALGARVFIHFWSAPEPVMVGAESRTTGEAFYRAQQAKSAVDIAQAIRADGGNAEAWEADLADPAAIPELFDRAEALGPVDILVNNAAHCEPDTFLPATRLGQDARAVDGFPLGAVSAAGHDRHFAVNTRAVALAMAECARRHVERGAKWGRIVNVSTDAAAGFATEVSYGASKYAMESLSRAAATELGPLGITVNVVSLGPIQTGWIRPDHEQAIARQTPLGRVGHPNDVADVIVFLASEQARWITGQLLYVGGGIRMSL